jgi:hypothetical protein
MKDRLTWTETIRGTRKVFVTRGMSTNAQITSNTPRAGKPVDALTALEYNCTC